MNEVPKDVYRGLQELNDLRWWNRRLAIGCVILSLGVISMAVALQATESGAMWSVKRAYDRGLQEGTVMKNDDLQKAFMAGYRASDDSWKKGDVKADAPGGRARLLGPLDLTKFTADQVGRLRCYLQSHPAPQFP